MPKIGLSEEGEKLAKRFHGFTRSDLKAVFLHLLSFKGVANQVEFGLVALVCWIILVVIWNMPFETVGLVGLLTYYVVLAASVRRLHDRGESGWLLLIGIVPALFRQPDLGLILVVPYLLLAPSKPHFSIEPIDPKQLDKERPKGSWYSRYLSSLGIVPSKKPKQKQYRSPSNPENTPPSDY